MRLLRWRGDDALFPQKDPPLQLTQSGGNVFHAAIAAGGSRIRAVNGGRPGSGWRYAVDLARVLGQDAAGGFTYNRANIRIHLSRL